MQTKTAEEMKDFSARFKEAKIHMLLHCAVWSVVVFLILLFVRNNTVLAVAGILSVIAFIFLLRRDCTNEQLALNSWLCVACVIICGITIGHFAQPEIILSGAAGVCIIDVISFTRIGKKTANAKLMGNKKWLTKLVVYGRSFKNEKPVATKGFGDYFWYTTTIASIFTAYGVMIGIGAILAILIGVLLNIFVISKIYKYTWYKGFPATIFPLGLCIIFIMFLAYMSYIEIVI